MQQEQLMLILSEMSRNDEQQYLHNCLVGLHWAKMASICGFTAEEIDFLLPAPLLHNVAKSITQFNKSHLERLGVSTKIIEMLRLYYEHWDGEGFLKLHGSILPDEVKILSLAHSFVTRIFQRQYRASFNVARTLKKLKCYSGIRFDPQLVDKIMSEQIYNVETYQNKEKLFRQIEREKEYLKETVENYGVLSHPLVYGQSKWLDILLVEETNYRYQASAN